MDRMLALLDDIIRKDDQKSFKEFFDHFYPRVLKFASYLIGSKQIAEDVAIEVFFKFWNNRKNIKNFENIQGYLLVSAKHTALNFLSKNKDIKFISFDGLNVKAITSYRNPENELIDRELSERLARAVDSLPEKCKMIYLLVKEEGLKYQEAADLLDISKKTVENQMGIALAKLRHELSDSKNTSGVSHFLNIAKTILILIP